MFHAGRKRGLTSALLLSTAFVAVSVVPAFADDQVETVVVTGSLLKRTDTETASPVLVISRDQIQNSGNTSVADVVRSISADSSGTIPTAFGAGFAAGSSGVALRGLTVNSTLVLINGRRTANYPLADDGERGFVDLNTIPLDVVDHVEVLKDGASAIYGADAIAGVVNIILRDSYQGMEGSAEAGTSQDGGGLMKRLTATVGFGDLSTDRFNVYINAEYEDDQHIRVSDRDFPFNTTDLSSIGGTNALGSTSIYGKAIPNVMGNEADPLSGGASTGPYQVEAAAGCGPLTVTTVTDARGTFCQQDNALYGDDQPRQERFGVYAHGAFQINADTQAYIDASFFQNHVEVDAAPTAIRTTSPTNTTVISLPAYLANGTVNPNDPFAVAGCASANNPAALPGAPACQGAELFYRFGDIPSYTDFSNRVIRATAGIRGTLWGWDYDAAVVAAHAELTSGYFGFVNEPALIQAIETGSYNFRNPAANTPQERATLAPPDTKSSSTDMDSADIRVNRSLFDLPAGPVDVGAGIEARHEATFDPDINATGEVQGLGKAHTIGSRSIYSAFAEADVPLFKDTFVGKADIDLSGRYDHYSDFGNSWVPKVAAKWQVIPEVLLRGTWSEGFRAPSFSENGSAAATGFITLDPTTQPGGDAFALAHGNDDYTLPYAFALITTANAAVRPETSRNYTGGIVVQPFSDFNLNVTFDYYNIKKNHIIQAADPTDAIAAAFLGQPIPVGFTVLYDNPDPLHPGAPLRPVSVAAPYVNALGLKTDGFDWEVQAGSDLWWDVSWSTDLEVTDINTYRVDAGNRIDEYVGTESSYNLSSGAGTPKWRGSWANSFKYFDTTATVTVYYVSGIKEIGLDAGGNSCLSASALGINNCHVPEFWDVDLTVRHQLDDNISIYGGIKNLFDASPGINPANYAGVNYNPTYNQAGIVGRFFQFGVTLKE